MFRRSRNSAFISARVSLYFSGMGTGGADATHSFLLQRDARREYHCYNSSGSSMAGRPIFAKTRKDGPTRELGAAFWNSLADGGEKTIPSWSHWSNGYEKGTSGENSQSSRGRCWGDEHQPRELWEFSPLVPFS